MKDKMTKEERNTAELAVENLHEAVEALNAAYEQVYDLAMEYGWDIDFDNISQASMLAGKEALGIVDSIAQEDGWKHYSVLDGVQSSNGVQEVERNLEGGKE
jgi:hypothetical protein